MTSRSTAAPWCPEVAWSSPAGRRSSPEETCSGTSGSVVHGGNVTIRGGAAANVLGGRVYVEEGATAYVISDDIEVSGPGRKVVYPVPRSPAVYPAPKRDFDSLRKGRLETVW